MDNCVFCPKKSGGTKTYQSNTCHLVFAWMSRESKETIPSKLRMDAARDQQLIDQLQGVPSPGHMGLVGIFTYRFTINIKQGIFDLL